MTNFSPLAETARLDALRAKTQARANLRKACGLIEDARAGFNRATNLIATAQILESNRI